MSDYGVPTSRERLFIVARNDGGPIIWPAPTHGDPKCGLIEVKTAADVIDWSIPVKSIFNVLPRMVQLTNSIKQIK